MNLWYNNSNNKIKYNAGTKALRSLHNWGDLGAFLCFYGKELIMWPRQSTKSG